MAHEMQIWWSKWSLLAARVSLIPVLMLALRYSSQKSEARNAIFHFSAKYSERQRGIASASVLSHHQLTINDALIRRSLGRIMIYYFAICDNALLCSALSFIEICACT